MEDDVLLGGVHTPFVARWPAHPPRGARVQAAVAHVDSFATAGAALPGERVMDGLDLVPLARGDAQGRPHDAIFWRSGPSRSTLAHDWTLRVQDRPPTMSLFDMAADLAEHERQRVAPSWPSLIEAPIPVDHPLGMPPAPDWEYVTWTS